MPIAPVERLNLLTLAIIAAVALTLDKPNPQASEIVWTFSASMLAGALLMAINVSVLGRLLWLFQKGSGGRSSKTFIAVLLPLKTAFLGVVVFVLFHYLALQPLAFVAGVGLIVLVPVPIGVWIAWKKGQRHKQVEA